MSRIRCGLVAAICLVTAFTVACQTTPSRVAFVNVAGANTAVDAVTDAYTAKTITRTQLLALVPLADAIKTDADAVDRDISAKSASLQTDSATLTSATNQLLNALAAAKKASAPPATTQP